MIILAVIMAIVLNKTRTGRYILALGSNKEAAIYSTLLPGSGGGGNKTGLLTRKCVAVRFLHLVRFLRNLAGEQENFDLNR